MREEYLPFARPSISKEAIAEVVACLESGWITTGPRVQQFEHDLKVYLKAPFCAALSSATAGLHLALLALDLQSGDEVITTPLTFAATLNTIILAGGKPVLVDVDPHTRNIDVRELDSAINERTRAVVPVHFAGLPVDLDPLYAIAYRHGLRVIEDAAHAIGGHYKGRRLGSFGDTQVFSFHPNKNMTTGEGGCVTTSDEELARKTSLLRFHGIDRDAWNRFSKEGSQHYDIFKPGYKYNMMDIQAALGLHQLRALDGFIARRTKLAEQYQQELADWPQWTLPGEPVYHHQHAWHLYTPLINVEAAGMNRDSFVAAMKARNIGTGLHYECAHLYAYYRERFGFRVGQFPHAEHIGAHTVSLPLFPAMTDANQERVIRSMAELFGRRVA
jgi:dTDP-4-amino-4,6-dideoxygalactose transaminase